MLSGPGRELMPSAMGARKYPLPSTCQGPPGTAFTSGVTLLGGSTAGGSAGGGCAVGSCARRGASTAGAFAGSSASAGMDTRHASNTKGAWNLRTIGYLFLCRDGL